MTVVYPKTTDQSSLLFHAKTNMTGQLSCNKIKTLTNQLCCIIRRCHRSVIYNLCIMLSRSVSYTMTTGQSANLYAWYKDTTSQSAKLYVSYKYTANRPAEFKPWKLIANNYISTTVASNSSLPKITFKWTNKYIHKCL